MLQRPTLTLAALILVAAGPATALASPAQATTSTSTSHPMVSTILSASAALRTAPSGTPSDLATATPAGSPTGGAPPTTAPTATPTPTAPTSDPATPDPATTATLSVPDRLTLPGPKKANPWPKKGQARLDVAGIGVIGIKTGSTRAAGGFLLFAAERTVNGRVYPVYGALLGAPGPRILTNALAASDKLIVAAARKTLHSATLIRAGRPIATLITADGTATDLTLATNLRVVGWPGLTYTLSLPTGLQPGQIPSTLTVRTSAQTITVPLIPAPRPAGPRGVGKGDLPPTPRG